LFDSVFSELFGRNFNLQFFTYRSWFEAFFYWLNGDVGGVVLKGRYLHTTVAVGSPLKAYYLHSSLGCCWWPLWKQGKVLAH